MVVITSDQRDVIFDAVRTMYTSVAHNPGKGYHFPTGRPATEYVGYPADLLDRVARDVRKSRGSGVPRWLMKSGGISQLPLYHRLALEMAANEDVERRALEGELRLLEAAWRDAEDVAKIADDMFLPEGTEARLDRMRRRE